MYKQGLGLAAHLKKVLAGDILLCAGLGDVHRMQDDAISVMTITGPRPHMSMSWGHRPLQTPDTASQLQAAGHFNFDS